MSRSNIIRSILVLLVFLGLAIAYQWTEGLDESSSIVWKIPIFVLGGALLAIVITVLFVPVIGDKMAQFFYMPPEEVEEDPGARARALVAQGHYDEALEAYLELAAEAPDDRLPVVEAMRLAREKLENPPRAMAIVRKALSGHSWPEEDETYFLFRLVEMMDEDLENREGAVAQLVEIIQRFPETRYAANATHKLREWDLDPKDLLADA